VRRRGISLVELLICIGIILILAGIASAVTGRIKTSAKISACASNLESIGRALHLYTNDFDDRVPPYVSADIISPIRSQPHSAAKLRECLARYGAEEKIWRCPLWYEGWNTSTTHDESFDRGLYVAPSLNFALYLDRARSLSPPALSNIVDAGKWKFLNDSGYPDPDDYQKTVTLHGLQRANALFFDLHVSEAIPNRS